MLLEQPLPLPHSFRPVLSTSRCMASTETIRMSGVPATVDAIGDKLAG